MKRMILAFAISLTALLAVSQSISRQRNAIYVLDCTGSMAGYNGAPNIWEPTKGFLKAELEKEAKTNPNARVTILPFQDCALNPINVNLKDIDWPKIDDALNAHLKKLTATNICDSWLEAEKFIDQSCDNYIYLLTDGHDNIGGNANESKRIAKLVEIFRSFCGKYKNTHGLYVVLTKEAQPSYDIKDVIDGCKDLYLIDATNGIPNFGCLSENVIDINTRDLPVDISIGFSNSGTFTGSFATSTNDYVVFSIKDGIISHGQVTLHVESKFGESINALNQAISADSISLPGSLQSNDNLVITNPDIDVILHTKPLRSLSIETNNSNNSVNIERIKPFLWVKGNSTDTLRWDLNPTFSSEAISDNSYISFLLKSNNDLSGYAIFFNGKSLPNDSVIRISPDNAAIIEVLLPQSIEDNTINLSLTEIESHNLDRINGMRTENYTLSIAGEFSTSISLIEIIFWAIVGLIVLFLLLWFIFIRNLKYPKFKRGRITIQSPYFASLNVKGYRLVIFSPITRKQSLFNRIWKGKILYHTNQTWPYNVEVSPTGKNMRFRCPTGQLISDPDSIWTRGNDYTIKQANNNSKTIKINISY